MWHAFGKRLRAYIAENIFLDFRVQSGGKKLLLQWFIYENFLTSKVHRNRHAVHNIDWCFFFRLLYLMAIWLRHSSRSWPWIILMLWLIRPLLLSLWFRTVSQPEHKVGVICFALIGWPLKIKALIVMGTVSK